MLKLVCSLSRLFSYDFIFLDRRLFHRVVNWLDLFRFFFSRKLFSQEIVKVVLFSLLEFLLSCKEPLSCVCCLVADLKVWDFLQNCVFNLLKKNWLRLTIESPQVVPSLSSFFFSNFCWKLVLLILNSKSVNEESAL